MIKRRRKSLWHSLCISVCAGLLAAFWSGQGTIEKATIPAAVPGGQLAWWGTLFPWFCFQDTAEKGKPEISFWLAKVLDW